MLDECFIYITHDQKPFLSCLKALSVFRSKGYYYLERNGWISSYFLINETFHRLTRHIGNDCIILDLALFCVDTYFLGEFSQTAKAVGLCINRLIFGFVLTIYELNIIEERLSHKIFESPFYVQRY
jgi:hypothetical protein